MFVCLQGTAQQVFLVMEYCNGGDLADYLNGNFYLFLTFIRLFMTLFINQVYIHNVMLDVFSNVCFSKRDIDRRHHSTVLTSVR